MLRLTSHVTARAKSHNVLVRNSRNRNGCYQQSVCYVTIMLPVRERTLIKLM